MTEKVQHTEKRLPFLVPEYNLKKGEIVVVDIPDRNEQKAGFSIIGQADRDGQVTFLPTQEKILNENGEIREKFRQFGMEKDVARWLMDSETLTKIMVSAERMSLILAVDREMNHAEKDNLTDYKLPTDGIPVETVGLVAKPRTGKTRLLLDMKLEAIAHGTLNNVVAVDMDDMTPESYNNTWQWLLGEIEEGRIEPQNYLQNFDKINQRIIELSGEDRNKDKKENYRDQLKKIREIYKNMGDDYINCRDFVTGDVVRRKKVMLIDLPGVDNDGKQVTENRPRDLLDCMFMAMPVVELFKAGEEMSSLALLFSRVIMDEQLNPKMVAWQIGVENSRRLVGMKPIIRNVEDAIRRIEQMNIKFSRVTVDDLVGAG